MFSLFSKSKKVPVADKTWKNREGLLAGITKTALETHKVEKVILVSWFDDKKQSLQNYLTLKNVRHAVGMEAMAEPGMINLLDASELAAHLGTIKGKVSYFFDGHYPLIQKEAELLERIGAQSQFSIIFFNSLDQGIMKFFGGEKLTGLLEKLGLGNDECIEHAMVSASILRAREKLSKEITNELMSRKEEEWFKKNTSL